MLVVASTKVTDRRGEWGGEEAGLLIRLTRQVRAKKPSTNT